jgi:hypothetical protein
MKNVFIALTFLVVLMLGSPATSSASIIDTNTASTNVVLTDTEAEASALDSVVRILRIIDAEGNVVGYLVTYDSGRQEVVAA